MPIELPVMDPCYFCQIISGAADRWSVVEETPLTSTLLNGRQYEVGQCFVVARRHAPTLLDLTPEEAAAVMSAAQRAYAAMVEAFNLARAATSRSARGVAAVTWPLRRGRGPRRRCGRRRGLRCR